MFHLNCALSLSYVNGYRGICQVVPVGGRVLMVAAVIEAELSAVERIAVELGAVIELDIGELESA